MSLSHTRTLALLHSNTHKGNLDSWIGHQFSLPFQTMPLLCFLHIMCQDGSLRWKANLRLVPYLLWPVEAVQEWEMVRRQNHWCKEPGSMFFLHVEVFQKQWTEALSRIKWLIKMEVSVQINNRLRPIQNQYVLTAIHPHLGQGTAALSLQMGRY